ncbi:MAG: hypothetical protein LN411_02680 [Candidatus Thermoplasmatota archaeon]|nr:hypothetical protein [Candidatus Thermoplasmatota archaeon]
MFPSHCKEVSVHSVGFELTEEQIRSHLMETRAYIRTRYMVLNRGDTWAVAEIGKDTMNSVLVPVSSVNIVSLPGETSFVDEPSLDVLSASEMGRLQKSVGTRCVIVRGMSEHISFFVDQEPFSLTIFDVVPPSPTKLVGLVEEALRSILQDHYVRYEVIEEDLNTLEGLSEARSVLFPCRASGLDHKGKIGYMDDPPALSPEQIEEVIVVGCSLSARVFKAVYGSEAHMVNMCPVDILQKIGIDGPVLTKCCKVKDGFDIKGNIAIVPWGARVTDVSAAIEALMAHMSC